jgi:hypothetical protein
LACGAGWIQYDSTATKGSFEFDCVSVPTGACKPDPTVQNCYGTRFVGISCSGTAKPTDALPALACLAAGEASGGATQYCCTY